jgi:photosystem II S4 domain protein
MLPRRQLLEGTQHRQRLAELISQAEIVLRTHQPSWSGFLSAPERQEVHERLGALKELSLHWDGGYLQAERRLLRLARSDAEAAELPPPLALVEISGNFLFDPADATDMRLALESTGLQAEVLGDVLLRGDRGALLLCTQAAAAELLSATLQVRSVICSLQSAGWELLPNQAPRQKSLTTVEASLRLDAVASAGFGISRNRMAEAIRGGRVRIAWNVVSSPSREVAAGDRIQLDGRGSLLVQSANITKRDRWRLELIREL